MKILVIEDDRDAAQYLGKALNEAGHAVDLAADGETGLTLAENGTHDVLVVGPHVATPRRFVRCGRTSCQGHENPRAFSVGFGEVDDRVTGLRAGGDDYLAKALRIFRIAGTC